MSITANDLSAEFEKLDQELLKPIAAVLNLQPDGLLAELNTARITINDIIERDSVCLEVAQKGKTYTWGTLGNFSAIIGKAKSRKSFLIAIMMAALLKRVLFGFITTTLYPGKERGLYFDTEQSKYHVLLAVKRIWSLSGMADTGMLDIYSLKDRMKDYFNSKGIINPVSTDYGRAFLFFYTKEIAGYMNSIYEG